jgi:hypothetical protein
MRTVGSFLVLALLASPAVADQTAHGIPPMSSLMLLHNPDVQKDLNLSTDQVKKVNDEINYQRTTRQGQRNKNDQTATTKNNELNQRCEKFLNECLKSDQSRRFNQIMCQVYGAQCFGKTECADQLKLTTDQRQKVKQIQEDTYKQVKNLTKSNANREETAKKRAEVVSRCNSQLMGLLTSQQKDQWKEMCGAPFQGTIRFGNWRAEYAKNAQQSGF